MVKEQLTELIKLVTNGATPTEQISFDGWFHNLNDIQDGIRGTVLACVYNLIGDIKQYTKDVKGVHFPYLQALLCYLLYVRLLHFPVAICPMFSNSVKAY